MMMKTKLPYILATLICYFHDLSGVFSVEEERVFVMDEDSVTLYTGVIRSQHEKIIWYFNVTRIALITKNLSQYCTDVQCYKGTERFRDRLNLDHQTGNLTIINIRTTDDTGNYTMMVHSDSRTQENTIKKIFSFAADSSGMKSLSVKEGESVTLVPGGNAYEMSWYFNNILIAQITGDHSLICKNAECKEKFTDRLKTENGSLSITNSKSTDSGEYKLMINNSSFSIVRRFTVNVTKSAHPEENPAVFIYVLPAVVAVAVVAVAVAAVAAVAAVILCRRHHNSSRQNETPTQRQDVEMEYAEAVRLTPGLEAANGSICYRE